MTGKIVATFLAFTSFAIAEWADADHRSRFEYKWSFKGPNLSQGDNKIPFWNYTGDAVPGDEQVRIVPSMRAKVGGVWSKYEFPHDKWQVEVHFRVQGRGRIGADGLVIWLVEKPAVQGPVYGYMNQWKGMGIVFDSFDNDARRNNPYVSVIVNDGTVEYDHPTDGAEQNQGGCLRDFRNKPYPVKARITYLNHELTLEIDSGNSPEADFEGCAVIPSSFIPKNYYFGVTAATGGLADDHDVLKFLTYSLHEKTDAAAPDEATDAGAEDADAGAEDADAQRKWKEEYARNLEEFRRDQEKFREAHPDRAKTDHFETQAEDLFEGGGSKELKSIFEVQTQIKKQMTAAVGVMATVMRKQDELMEAMDRNNVELIARGEQRGGVGSNQPPVATQRDVNDAVDVMRIAIEGVEALKAQNQQLQSADATMSRMLEEMSSRVAGLSGGGGAQLDGKIELLKSTLFELRNSQLKLEKLQQQQQQRAELRREPDPAPPVLKCPEPPKCVSPALFLLVGLIQVLLLAICYVIKSYRDNQYNKKFF